VVVQVVTVPVILLPDTNVPTQLNSTNLLNVSISGLPHVVIFYDALQRLPRQLHQKETTVSKNNTYK